MSKYQEISKTFAESVQLQAQYISECCEFSNVFFSQMAEYLDRIGKFIFPIPEAPVTQG